MVERNEAAPGAKYSMRLSMPADDEVVRAFAEAQGSRSLAPAIRQLIHMWVNEFGAVNVIDTMTSSITLPGLARLNRGQHAAPAPAATGPHPNDPVFTAQPLEPQAPVAQPVAEVPAPAPAPVTQQAPAAPAAQVPVPQPEAPAPAPAPAAPAASSGDVNSIFRGGA